MKKFVVFFLAPLLLLSPPSFAGGNTWNDSFSRAKKTLEQQVYYDHRNTLYCGAEFDARKRVALPEGFTTPSHEKRAAKVEWEHAVPAENFGRAFVEWRDGAPQCVDNRGTAFKGRKCAEKVSVEYRRMQADMYNLYPAIGAVNAVRGNKQYSALADVPPAFGTCLAKIDGNRFEPPDTAKGQVARSALYMADAYGPRYRLSSQQQQLFEAWDRMFPVDEWECQRAKRIEEIQGNENLRTKYSCQQEDMWD